MADKEKAAMASSQPPSYNSQAPAYQPNPPQGYQQSPYPQAPAPGMGPAAPTGMSVDEQRKNERRGREKDATHCMMGMLCGGCLVALCIGQERAADCGVRVMDRLLCMDMHCGGC
eukprot:m.20005 g.20005  ORF g.20005 m.20005 type:complete len:115 (-) comp10085_c0_seq1:110-454(-)